ncbi:MAG: exodeoxyribonuclease gamma subunit, partial [Pseudonocardiales bacterium]|nr:exodeoxyribonuclease gamma subunit [Pseudonocardiales bacterium]
YRVTESGAAEPASRDVDVVLPDGTRVVGTVSGLYGEVAVRVEFSKLGAKQRVRAWARLVALTAAQPDGRWRVVTVGRGSRGGVAVASAGPLDPDRARGLLADLVALHREGLRAPLPLPTNAALAYVRTLTGSGNPDAALAEATRTWCEGRYPERDEALYVRVFGEKAGPDVLTPGPFGDLALRLWRPLLEAETLR